MLVPTTAEGILSLLLCSLLYIYIFYITYNCVQDLSFCVTDSNKDGSVWKPEKATLKSSVTGEAAFL